MDELVVAEWAVCTYGVIVCIYITWQARKIRHLRHQWNERVKAIRAFQSAVNDALFLFKDLADFLAIREPAGRKELGEGCPAARRVYPPLKAGRNLAPRESCWPCRPSSARTSCMSAREVCER